MPLEVIGTTKKHGTYVRFKPDATIFSTVEFNWDTISSHLQESAFLMKGVEFVLMDEKTGQSVNFLYENGLVEYINNINSNKSPLSGVISFSDTDEESILNLGIRVKTS